MPLKTDKTESKLLQRKEMKKAKAIIVRGTKELPNMLVKDTTTPYEALAKLQKSIKSRKYVKILTNWMEIGIISRYQIHRLIQT